MSNALPGEWGIWHHGLPNPLYFPTLLRGRGWGMKLTGALPSRASTAQKSSSLISWFFYLVLTVSGEFQHGWVAGAEREQDGGLEFLRRKSKGYIRPSYIWAIQVRLSFGSLTTHTDNHCVTENSQQKQSTKVQLVLNVSLFMYYCHYEKSNLLSFIFKFIYCSIVQMLKVCLTLVLLPVLR